MEPSDRVRSLPRARSLIRYHLGVILASVVLTLGLATLYVANLPSTYTASAVILLSPAPGNPLTAESASSSGLQMTVALETEAQLVKTPAVFDLVSRELGRSVPDSGEDLDVSIPSNTQMLKVSFTSISPERAREGAQAFADGYLRYRGERAGTVQDARIKQLKVQISDTEADLRRAIADAGSSAYASQEVLLFVDRLAGLNNSLSSTDLVSTYPGSVTSSPMPPESANGLPNWLMLAAAAGAGLAIGIGLALWREWRRDLIRDADIGLESGVPVLATIQLEGLGELAFESGPITHESYRRLRTAIIANAPRPHTLAFTVVGGESARGGSALSAEVAANLAVVLGEAKFSVLLMTTNPLQHRVEEILGLEAEVGLSDVVLGGASVLESLVSRHGISVLPAGQTLRGSSDLTATSGFHSLMNDLRQHFDYIIIAAAPAGSSGGDAALLVADSTMLVLTPDKTERTLLWVALDRLQHLGVETLGAVRVAVGHRPRASRRDRDVRRKSRPLAARAVNSMEEEKVTVAD